MASVQSTEAISCISPLFSVLGVNMDEIVQAVMNLGFNRLEAEVYVYLVEHSPATGYGVAKGLRKTAASVYKVLESLEGKGAVIFSSEKKKMVLAVQPQELLEHLENRFQKDKRKAGESLSRLKPSEAKDLIFQISTYDQVLERAYAILSRCQGIAVVDLFPDVVEPLRDRLESLYQEGKTVLVKVYRPVELNVTELLVSPHGDAVLQAWCGSWLNVVVDATECLLALLGEQKVYQAVWSKSAYLSLLNYNGFAAEMRADAYEAAIHDGASGKELKALVAKMVELTLHPPDLQGRAELIQQLKEDHSSSKQKM